MDLIRGLFELTQLSMYFSILKMLELGIQPSESAIEAFRRRRSLQQYILPDVPSNERTVEAEAGNVLEEQVVNFLPDSFHFETSPIEKAKQVALLRPHQSKESAAFVGTVSGIFGDAKSLFQPVFEKDETFAKRSVFEIPEPRVEMHCGLLRRRGVHDGEIYLAAHQNDTLKLVKLLKVRQEMNLSWDTQPAPKLLPKLIKADRIKTFSLILQTAPLMAKKLANCSSKIDEAIRGKAIWQELIQRARQVNSDLESNE